METIVHDIYDINQNNVISKIQSKEQSVLIPQLTLFNKGER